ncbi:hypothetical protein PUN28_000797 [Cardiocondyla obscurior]|uniref:Uncharacterized protein n=1 Tax=Cardiocondyla obscurior TaxID=286306 RepID=A0AAW2H112_9HYME
MRQLTLPHSIGRIPAAITDRISLAIASRAYSTDYPALKQLRKIFRRSIYKGSIGSATNEFPFRFAPAEMAFQSMRQISVTICRRTVSLVPPSDSTERNGFPIAINNTFPTNGDTKSRERRRRNGESHGGIKRERQKVVDTVGFPINANYDSFITVVIRIRKWVLRRLPAWRFVRQARSDFGFCHW